MDVKKLVTITYACSNFKDEEINRIMQDRTARSTFLDIMDCYKIDDTPQKLECTLNKVLTKTCAKESQELFACIKENPKNTKVCYVPTVNSQRCLDEQLHNLMMVSKGMN